MDYFITNFETLAKFIELNNLSWEGLIIEELKDGNCRVYSHLPVKRRRYSKRKIGKKILKTYCFLLTKGLL